MAETERDRRRESGVPVAAIFLGVAAANRLAQAGEPRPQQAMEKAAEMRAQGASERAIYRATNKILEGTEYAGVSYDAAGEPVFEASDKNVKLKGGALKSGAAYLGEVLPRPESAGGSALAGRDLVPVEIGQGTGLTDGTISLDKSYEKTLAGMKWVKGEARGALLHEEQHVGHIIEDRPAGGHPDNFREPMVAIKGGKRIVTKAIPGNDAASQRVREQAYGILAGEQEAELTRASADMSAGERRAIHPDDRKYPGKVPKDKQLVVYDGGRQAMARGIGDNRSPEQAKLDRAADKLEAVARRTIESSQKEVNAPRLMNTARRARLGSGVIEQHQQNIADAKTALKIAEALRNGEAGALANVKSLADVRELRRLAKEAEWATDRAQGRKWKEGGHGITTDDARNLGGAKGYVRLEPTEVERIKTALGNTKGLAADFRTLARFAERAKARNSFETSSPDVFKAIAKVANAIKKADPNTLTVQYKHEVRSLKWQANKYLEEVRDFNRQVKLAGADPTGRQEALKAFLAVREGKVAPNPAAVLERNLIGQKIPGFFPTPESLAQRMAELADIQKGQMVLEPSAGTGRLAAIAKAMGAKVDAVEVSSRLQDILKAKGLDVVASDFTEMAPEAKYDRVLMNPPFEKGQDMQHVRKAFEMLKPGGKMVAVMGEGAFFRSDKQATEFRNWLQGVGGSSEKLPEGTFKESNTGVNTRLVTISKPAEVAEQAMRSSTARPNMPETVHEDVRGVPTQIRPGADGDPFKYKSRWHESVEFDKDGYPGKTTIVHAATLEEYESKLRAIDEARAAAGLKPRHVWDDAAREASAKVRAADAKAPTVESAIERAMRTSAERAKTTTGTLVKPALSEDAAKQAKFSRDMADLLSREAQKSLEIAAKGENAGNKLHFELRAHEQQQTAKLYADRAVEIESGKQKFLPGPTEVDALKAKIAAHDEGVFNGKPVGWDSDAPVKVEDAVKHPGTPIPPKPKGPPRLMGIPADGSKPFVMAILDSPGDPADAAKRIYNDTARLYTQKLAGYQVEDAAGNKLIGFQDKDTLNAALKAQGKAESGKAEPLPVLSKADKAKITRMAKKAAAGGEDAVHRAKLAVSANADTPLRKVQADYFSKALDRVSKASAKLGSVAMIAAPVAAAAVAYDATRSEAKAAGASDTDATRKAMASAAVAGGATAGVMAGVGVAAKFALTRVLPAAAAGPAGWALLGGMTAYGAYRAYQAHKDKGLGGTAAALSLIGADEALHLVKRDAGPTRLNAEQAAAYKAANARHAAMQAQAPASTNKLVGFQNPANLESAMASQNKHWDGVYGKKS